MAQRSKPPDRPAAAQIMLYDEHRQPIQSRDPEQQRAAISAIVLMALGEGGIASSVAPSMCWGRCRRKPG